MRFLGDDAAHAPRAWRTSPEFPGLADELPAGAPMDNPRFPVLWPRSRLGPDVADPVDELFSLPLEEFTAARNRLAKEHGPEIRQIAKPTVPAWVVNQLARRHADLVGRLVDAGEEQARALKAGAGMREAQAAERKAIAELVRKARTILEGSGRKATTPVLDRVAATLAAGHRPTRVARRFARGA